MGQDQENPRSLEAASKRLSSRPHIPLLSPNPPSSPPGPPQSSKKASNLPRTGTAGNNCGLVREILSKVSWSSRVGHRPQG